MSDDNTFFSSMPPYEAIDWTDENQWMFLNGVIKIETMTRERFMELYPDDNARRTGGAK